MSESDPVGKRAEHTTRCSEDDVPGLRVGSVHQTPVGGRRREQDCLTETNSFNRQSTRRPSEPAKLNKVAPKLNVDGSTGSQSVARVAIRMVLLLHVGVVPKPGETISTGSDAKLSCRTTEECLSAVSGWLQRSKIAAGSETPGKPGIGTSSLRVRGCGEVEA